MKLTAAIAMTAVLVTSSRPVQGREQERVIVHLEDSAGVQGMVLLDAQSLAGRMFRTAGVRLDWRLDGRAPCASGRQLLIELVTNTPENFHRGSLAFTGPYERIHITVFYDRVYDIGVHSRITTQLLAHVLVHEITHILQGITRHSETGIMKAHWTPEDYEQMQVRPLSFTRKDVELIQIGLASPTSCARPNSILRRAEVLSTGVVNCRDWSARQICKPLYFCDMASPAHRKALIAERR
jgi:hypothetical protein